MKTRIIAALFIFLSGSLLVSKELIIPDNTQIKENFAIESVLCNLADSEIYRPIDIQVIDEFMIIGNIKSIEIVKLDLKGNVLARNGNKGRGPGEFRTCLSPRKAGDNIAFLDIGNKIVFYDMNLKFIKEIKLPKISRYFLLLENKYFIFSENARIGFYLSRYASDGKLVEKFGKKERKFDPRDEHSFSDRARSLSFDKVRNLIWCDNLRKYELRSFYNGEQNNLVRPEKELFKEFMNKDEDSGEQFADIDSRSIRLISVKDKLYYFFNKKEIGYVDVFDLKKLSHLKRIKLKNLYVLITHIIEDDFFGISYDEEGDPLLYKIEISGFKQI